MNSVNKGVIIVSDRAKIDFEHSKLIIDGTSWRELKDVDDDVMIGCFNYNGKSAFYVVNYSKEFAQHVTLKFHDKYEMKVVQNAEEKFVKAKNLKLDMKAGEGLLIVME